MQRILIVNEGPSLTSTSSWPDPTEDYPDDDMAETPHPMPPSKLGGARVGPPGVCRGRWIDCTPTRDQAA